MALLNDDLSLWEIGFRWTGRDPDRFWLRIPLAVRDNFRTLMDAILRGHLDCLTLALEKWNPAKHDAELKPLFIRHHLDVVEDCIGGKTFDRRLLKWARIERWAMQQWCERQGVAPPEFWFPAGWKLEYEWPSDDPAEEEQAGTNAGAAGSGESVEERKRRIDKRHRMQMACQQIAWAVWSKEPNLTIKEVANRCEVQELGGGSEYEIETVQEWISALDPRDPRKKRGRKRKDNPPPDNPLE